MKDPEGYKQGQARRQTHTNSETINTDRPNDNTCM